MESSKTGVQDLQVPPYPLKCPGLVHQQTWRPLQPQPGRLAAAAGIQTAKRGPAPWTLGRTTPPLPMEALWDGDGVGWMHKGVESALGEVVGLRLGL